MSTSTLGVSNRLLALTIIQILEATQLPEVTSSAQFQCLPPMPPEIQPVLTTGLLMNSTCDNLLPSSSGLQPGFTRPHPHVSATIVDQTLQPIVTTLQDC
ncbi:expressed unknown protein [Seminavis robusta]|uniref:Uncharacterized protein n=1 Tax=Seminavis robusta TaxID=568900 RepID=A0A9N8ERI4_9STRA|nr:expressed unknown protein [Seminavis robusta]|eukprot:Sro1457_g274340.1 n/a (100) ;mRNA; f:11479-11860